ncbi:MAG: hypothetical protein ACE5Q7_02100, partial [Candidatus Nitrosomaritimum yanchengensis]
MKYLLALIIFSGFFTSAFAQEDVKNPSIIINTLEIPFEDFNTISRDATVFELEESHAISWNITIDNNLVYANPDGNAVLKLYDKNSDKFIEVGMG